MKTIFPEEMLNSSQEAMTLESIASKLTWFELQLHMGHWQTSSHATHEALNLYNTIHDFTDDFIEKLMGYSKRKIRELKIPPIDSNINANKIVENIISYSEELSKFAKANRYSDLDNMAQELSGNAAKTLFLLTLS